MIKNRKLVFIYLEEDKAKMLMVNEKVIEIGYAKIASAYKLINY